MQKRFRHTHPASAKITRPQLPAVLARDRLFQQLDDSRRYPLVWVDGLPGSGKTTLVASYLDAREIPCIWYQTDEGDDDPATFFYYLGLAAKKAAPRLRRPLPLLTAEYALGIHSFAKRYFESLFSRLKQPFLLVLDNYQAVTAGSMLHHIILDGISVIPQGMQVVVISRSEPPAAFARLQANDRMMITGGEQLRLTTEELTEIMRQQIALDPSPEMVRLVSQKTRGWAAGALLLSRAMKLGIPGADLSTLPVSEKVMDYFSNEVFEKTDAQTQDFLLKTSFMTYITPGIAAELSGHAEADRILSAMHRRNLFVERRTDPEHTYQYHPLFRDFLLARARKVFTTQELVHLQDSAARLLDRSGHNEDAAALYREAGEWDGLVALIEKHAAVLMEKGRYRTLAGWIAMLPKDRIEQDPWLLYWRGKSTLPFNPVASKPDLKRAFSLFTTRKDGIGIFLAWAGVVDSILLPFDKLSLLDHWFKVLQHIMRTYKTFPTQEIETRVALSMFAALSSRKPDHPDAMMWRERMLSLVDRSKDRNLQAVAAFYASWHELFVGNPEKSAIILRSVKGLVKSDKLPPLARIMVKTVSSIHSWLKGKNEECQEMVSAALHAADDTGVHVLDCHVLGSGITSALTCGDTERARELLRLMETGFPQFATVGKAYYYYLASWLALIQKDLGSAQEYAVRGLEYVERVGSKFSFAVNAAGAAAVYHEQKNHDESEKLMKRALHIAEEMNSPAALFMCNLAAAQFAYDRENDDAGRKALLRAMTIGREQGYMNIYGWRQDVMSRLCAKALELGIEPGYVRELIRTRNLMPEKAPVAAEDWPWPVKIYTLGRFNLIENDEAQLLSGKSRKKPLDMLKAIVALGGRGISEQKLSDALWPDALCDSGRSLFKTTLHRLRQMLLHREAIIMQEGKLTLDNRLCWVDAWTFERLIGKAEKMWLRGPEGKGASTIMDRQREAAKLTEKAIALYKGHFLEGDNNESWTVSLREHLKIRYINAVGRLGAFWEQGGELERAADCYQLGLRVDDLTEEFYQDLIQCYKKLGRRAEAIKTYQRCSSVMKASFGIEPSPETTALYKSVIN